MNTRELATAIAERLRLAAPNGAPSLSSEVVAATPVEDPDKDGTWGVQITTEEGEMYFVHVEQEEDAGPVHYPNGLDEPQPYVFGSLRSRPVEWIFDPEAGTGE